jgi:hypothetical protein
MMPIDEKIMTIQRDLMRIQSNLCHLMTDVASLAADINPPPASATMPPAIGPPNPPGRFERDILMYGQHHAARVFLELAVNAGALLPRGDLAFIIEQDPSNDKRPNILSWPLPAADSPHSLADSVTLPPSVNVASDSSSLADMPTRGVTAVRQAGHGIPRRLPRRVPAFWRA